VPLEIRCGSAIFAIGPASICDASNTWHSERSRSRSVVNVTSQPASSAFVVLDKLRLHVRVRRDAERHDDEKSDEGGLHDREHAPRSMPQQDVVDFARGWARWRQFFWERLRHREIRALEQHQRDHGDEEHARDHDPPPRELLLLGVSFYDVLEATHVPPERSATR